MSEERLQEIKDSIETGLTGAKLQALNYAEGVYEDALELYNEVIRLREELSKCTRKHWQSKCAEHCINEKLLQSKIDKAIEYIEEARKQDFMWSPIFMKELLDILRGGNNV